MWNKLAFKVAVLVNTVLLVVMAVGGWYLAGQQEASLEAQLRERGRMESLIGAKLVGRVLEEAIDNGALTLAEVFDRDYRLIPGFEPAKYHTKYDTYLDKAILTMQDEFLKDDSIVFAAAVDAKGYLPTHNTRFQQPITGDVAKDLVGNRTKRIFNDPIGLKAARNLDEGFVQVYQRDTGETMWDVSTPIFVKGKHWGGFRIGFSLEKMAAAKLALRIKLAIVMAVILLVSTLLVVLTVQQAMFPLTKFTKVASALADGDVNHKIDSNRKDEIGQLADVLERLRISLKAAMDRLQKGRATRSSQAG